MDKDIIQNSIYKRDISNAVDYLYSYYRRSKRGKPFKKLIRVYTGYSCTTGAMGHSSLFDKGHYHTGKDPFSDPHLYKVYEDENSKKRCTHYYVSQLVELKNKYNLKY